MLSSPVPTMPPSARRARRLTIAVAIALLALPLAAGSLTAQATDTAPVAALPPADTPLPVDPNVRIGSLDNGLRYFIRVNGRPENRAELRLVVNAGSVLEDDDQRGLAHFLEHMAFNGTSRFAKNDIVKYLESIGVRFGADLNAYTGFDETVYILPVPTDSAGLLDRSLDILEDWASAVRIDSADVVDERGVVMEEWRGGRGAGARILDRHFPILFAGSRYAERLPIGDTAIIAHVDPAPVRRFYERWYRPDNMAVVAVGDFDPDRVEAMIRERFARLPKPATPLARPEPAVPANDGTLVSIATDPELTISSVEVVWKLPPRITKTVGAWRTRLAEDIYNAAFNRRLAEITQKPNAPWLSASSGVGGFARSAASYQLSVAAADTGILPALAAILVEARRVDEHGFLPSEIARVKTDIARSYERQFAEREKSESGGFAGSYINHFLTGAAIPGITWYYRHVGAALASISNDEVNAVGRGWISDSNRVVLVSQAEREGITPPTRAELLATITRLRDTVVPPWTETLSDDALIATLPAPGRIAARDSIPALGVTSWTFANGARVLLKPTDFKADEVIFSGFAPGGASLYPDSLALIAELAGTLVEFGGIGEFSRIDLNKKLSGKVAGASAGIGDLFTSVSGRASPKDLETALQLLHLRFTAPRADTNAVKAFKQQIGAVFANRGRDPNAVFGDTVTVTLADHHPRVRLPSKELIDGLSLDDAMRIYRERLADASNFTFVFTGNVAPATLEPLIAQYIGSLPGGGRDETWRDVGIRPPSGVVEKIVRRGTEPKAQTLIVYHQEAAVSDTERQAFRTLGEVLETRLTEELREALGGTYSVGVNASASTQPAERYQLLVQYGSAPEKVDTLFAAVQREIAKLRENGPDSTTLAGVLEQQRRELEVAQKQNGFWISSLVGALQNGRDPARILEARARIDATTAAAVRDVARKAVLDTQYVRLMLLPEEAAPKPPTVP